MPHSPKAAAVGLAQDTVVWRGQGVKPEAGKALAGIRLQGGGALKSVVTVGGQKSGQKTGLGGDGSWSGAGASQQGPAMHLVCGDTQPRPA